jgi:beta-mannosidase
MNSLLLDQWEVLDVAPGTGHATRAATDGGEGWIPTPAPGDVYLALNQAGRLAHPWRGRGEAEAAWVCDREWWWRTRIEAPAIPDGDVAELVFEGLDTFATIYLDGEEIGRAANMFRRYVLDVTPRLKPGQAHVLAIRFDPPVLAVEVEPLPVWTSFTDRVSRSNRNQMRKAQFGWGWDWGPDLPTVGIWLPARLDIGPAARITDVRFQTKSIAPDLAEVEIELTLSAGVDRAAAIAITLTDPDGRVVYRHQAAADDVPSSIRVKIPDPRLWWTADLGDQPLHELRVQLFEADRTLDEVTQRVGLRTLVLDQSADPDEPGTTFFRFVLNGVPIFAKGACWVPASSFVGAVDAAAYARLIDQTVAANMNMIRVWGGGVYEPDLFYDLCDQRGVLVWQDFMFACAHYPEGEAFTASVTAEIEDQVRRLRHHPCLALWCGNNENQAIHRIDGDRMGVDLPLSGRHLYDEVMPAVVTRLDPATPYWPGSPWGGPNPNSMKAGDVHDWTVWHGVPPIPDDVMEGDFRSDPEGLSYIRYAQDTGRFISEFGLQAAPAMATLERWMDPADLDLDSPGFFERIKDEARKAEAMMAPITGLPTDLQAYVDFTQWSQAEGLKYGIEHFRRRRPHCSGALIWQLNDCWPCVSWSLIDHDGVPKASWFAVRRAFAPLLASFRDTPDGQVELWISNDTLAEASGEAQVTLETLDGQTVWRSTVEWSAPSGGHAVIWIGPAPTAADQVLRVRSGDGAFEPNRRLSVPIKDLPLTPGAEPQARFAQTAPNRIEVALTAPCWLAFVHLTSTRTDLKFSDNFFDLAAGETRTISVSADAPIAAADLTVRGWNGAHA